MTEQRYVDYTFSDGCARVTLIDGDNGSPLHPESCAQLLAAVLQAKADREAESISCLGASPSGHEGIAAFLEKRARKFR